MQLTAVVIADRTFLRPSVWSTGHDEAQPIRQGTAMPNSSFLGPAPPPQGSNASKDPGAVSF